MLANAVSASFAICRFCLPPDCTVTLFSSSLYYLLLELTRRLSLNGLDSAILASARPAHARAQRRRRLRRHRTEHGRELHRRRHLSLTRIEISRNERDRRNRLDRTEGCGDPVPRRFRSRARRRRRARPDRAEGGARLRLGPILDAARRLEESQRLVVAPCGPIANGRALRECRKTSHGDHTGGSPADSRTGRSRPAPVRPTRELDARLGGRGSHMDRWTTRRLRPPGRV